MISRITRLSALALLLCGCLFVCSSCSKDDSGGSAFTSRFSIRFGTSFLGQGERCFVIVANPTGDYVLAAQEVTEPGLVTFQHVSDRVSVTIATLAPNLKDMWSFLDVPAGEWHLGDYLELMQRQVNLNVTYPTGSYSDLLLSSTNTGTDLPSNPGDSTGKQVTVSVDFLSPDSTGTILGIIRGNSQNYCGWVQGIPITHSDTAHYALNLDRPTEARTLTASRPLRNLYVSILRGTVPYIYLESFWPMFGDTASATNEFHIAHCSQFPADRLMIEGRGTSDNQSFYFYELSDQLPGSVTIPDMSVSAVFDTLHGGFHNISVTGSPDAVEASWGFFGNDMSYYWSVEARAGTTSLHLPAMPDSIMTTMGMTSQNFPPNSLSAHDYDTAHNFDDYIRLQYQTTGPEFSGYNWYLSTNAQISFGSPQPLRHRHRAMIRPAMPDQPL